MSWRSNLPAHEVRASGGGATRRSLRLDVRCLDDRPPLLDFGLLLRGKRLRRLFLARPDFLTHVDEPLSYRRIGQGLYDRRVELADDIPGRVLGSPKAVP